MSASRTDWVSLAAELSAAGLECAPEVPLAPHTTYQIGGNARCAVSVSSADEAVALAGVLVGHRDTDVLLVGRGSNLLVADEGFDGLAVLVGGRGRIPGSGRGRPEGRDDGITIESDTVVATGWTLLPVLARRSVAAGRCGLQWAVGVPGTVGGAVRMNAGGHGADVADSITGCSIVSLRSGRTAEVPAESLGLHFRGSALADHHLVLGAAFATTVARDDSCEKELAEIVAWRRTNQPGGRNAGSVFVNPAPGEGSAGALIDAAGLRGRRVGGVEVSERHANFIQADPGARAGEVVDLMCEVQDEVARTHGTVLRSEVRLVGFDPETVGRFSDPRHEEPSRVAMREHLADLVGDRRGDGEPQ